MKTSKPFSTISYNSVEFLTNKLEDLVTKNVISWYAFIKHYKEEDESKDHIHLFVIPNGLYQTDQLKPYLQELDLLHLDKPPLGIMPCKSSKFADWYLYCTHDVAYLTSKMQSRHYHYTLDEFITSNSDYLLEMVHTIDRSKYGKTQDFIEKIKAGVSFFDLVTAGQVPAPQFNQWQSLYNFVKGDEVYRSDRTTHSPREPLQSPREPQQPIQEEKTVDDIFAEFTAVEDEELPF